MQPKEEELNNEKIVVTPSSRVLPHTDVTDPKDYTAGSASTNFPSPVIAESESNQLDQATHTDDGSSAKKSWKKRVLIVAIVLLAVVLLGAMNPWKSDSTLEDIRYSNHTGNQGWSIAQATTQWESIKGIDRVLIRGYEWRSEPFKTTLGARQVDTGTQGVIEISVKNGYHVSDGAALLDAARETLWALNDLHMDSTSPVAVYLKADYPEIIAWKQHFDESLYEKYAPHPAPATPNGLETEPYKPEFSNALLLHPTTAKLGDRIGKVPELESGFIATGPAPKQYEVIDTVSVTQSRSVPDEVCYAIRIVPPQHVIVQQQNTNIPDFRFNVELLIDGIVPTTTVNGYSQLTKSEIASLRSKSGSEWRTRICLPGNVASDNIDIRINDKERSAWATKHFLPVANRNFLLDDILTHEP
jgi:hypothetical protein